MTALAGAPTSIADIQALLDGTIYKPVVRLVQQVNQSFPDVTDQLITFGGAAEIVDTHGFHSTSVNDSRITPNKPGWYTFRGTFVMPALATWANMQLVIRKNGSAVAPTVRVGPNATPSQRSLQVVMLEQANGVSDYFEVYGHQDNTANSSQSTQSNGGSFSCVFECIFERNL
jgi:hypothetical protein